MKQEATGGRRGSFHWRPGCFMGAPRFALDFSCLIFFLLSNFVGGCRYRFICQVKTTFILFELRSPIRYDQDKDASSDWFFERREHDTIFRKSPQNSWNQGIISRVGIFTQYCDKYVGFVVGGGLRYGGQLSSDHLNLLFSRLFIRNGTTRLKQNLLFLTRKDDLSF